MNGMIQTPDAIESVALMALDGYRLSAYLYRPKGEPIGNIIVAGATGVSQRFYKRFAEYACNRGYNVLTMDYRGIGESKQGSLRDLKMSFIDWGRLDIAAAVDFMAANDTLPLFMVGHSYGGHALGLLPNHHKIKAGYFFATGAGWAGWMPLMEALKTHLLWNVVLPVIVAWKGYMAWSMLGMGEDLPVGVYEDWKRWCTYQNYFFDDPSMAAVAQRYGNVRTPAVFANATDDAWALPISRDAFIRGYRNAPIITKDIVPTSEEVIGHMGYFRSPAAHLWDDVFRFFQEG